MKKISILILTVILLMAANTMVAFAGDSEVELVPKGNVDSAIEQESEKYPDSHYQFDSEEMDMFDAIPNMLKTFTNFLFYINVFISRIANFLLTQAFTLDIFTYIGDIFDDLVGSMKDAIFAPLLLIVLPITGIAIVFYALVNKGTKAIILFIQTIAIMVVAYGFMSAPSLVVTMVNDVSRELSGSTLASTATLVNGTTTTANDAVVNLSNIYWASSVRNPWEIIEFGKTVADADAEAYLELAPGDEARLKMAKDEDNMMFKKDGQVIRLAVVFFLLIINLVMAVLMIFLSFLMFITQFAAIMAGIIAVLGFVMALLPNMGLRVAIRAVYNIFEFLLTRLGITLLLCMYFAISNVFYDHVDTMGWFLVMILQLGLMAAVILYRKKIFSFVTAATKGQQAMIGAMERTKIDPKRLALEAYAGAKMYQDAKGMVDRRRDRHLEKKLKPAAEEHLYKQYDDEVRAAETQAKKDGKEVQYSDFVRRTNARVERGYTPFSEDDIQRSTGMMKSLKREGMDPERMNMTTVSGKSDKVIEHDEQFVENRIEKRREELNQKSKQNSKDYESVIRTDENSKYYSLRRDMLEEAKAFGSNANKATGMYIKDVAMGSKNEPEYTAEIRTEIPSAGLTRNLVTDNKASAPEDQPEAAAAEQPITADGATVQEMPREMENKKNTHENVSQANVSKSTVNESIQREVSTQNVQENVQNTNSTVTEQVGNREVQTVNQTADTVNKVNNVKEVSTNVASTDRTETVTTERSTINENKEHVTVNENKSEHVANTNVKAENVTNTSTKTESVTNSTSREENNFINLEAKTQNNKKDVKNTVSNVQNTVVENHEKVNTNVVNTQNVQQKNERERNETYQEGNDSIPNRREFLEKLRKKNDE